MTQSKKSFTQHTNKSAGVLRREMTGRLAGHEDLVMKFGTSGLRGLVTELEGHASALYATAFARHLLETGMAKPGDELFVAGDFSALQSVHRRNLHDSVETCRPGTG